MTRLPDLERCRSGQQPVQPHHCSFVTRLATCRRARHKSSMLRATNDAPSTATLQQHTNDPVQDSKSVEGGEVLLETKRAYLIYNPVAGGTAARSMSPSDRVPPVCCRCGLMP
jgi:hypothetical protein